MGSFDYLSVGDTNQLVAHNLGTRNDIILNGTEWFSVETVAAWQLFRLILNHYDGRVVNDGNYAAFSAAVLNLLWGASETSGQSEMARLERYGGDQATLIVSACVFL
jgi:hypothetical protein